MNDNQLIKNMPVAYALHEMIYDEKGVGVDYRYLDINAEFEKQTQLSAANIIGRTCLEIMPDTENFWIQRYDECVRLQTEIQFEAYSSVLKRDYQVVAYSPAPGQFVTMFFDISKKQIEEHKSNKVTSFFQSITENSTEGVVVLNTEMRFTYVSTGASKMFGYKVDDLQFLEPDKLTHPDDLDFVIEALNKLIVNPEYKPTLEYRFKKKNGDWIWIESTITNLFSNPEVSGIVINFRDITERKNYIEKLQLSEQRYRLTQEAGNIGSWEYYIGTKKYWNSGHLRQIFGIENTESVDVNDEIESCIINNDFVKQTLFNLITENKPYDIEFEIIRRNDGARRIIKSQAHLVYNTSTNEQLLVRGILTDITVQKQYELKIKQSEAILAATLVHSRFGIWSVDTNNILLYANETFTEDFFNTFGVKLEIGKSIIDILPKPLDELWLNRYKKAFANNSFVEEDKYETPIGDIYLEVSTTPILIDGKVVGASFYGVDITKRKNTEIAIRKSEEKYQELYNLIRLMADTLPDMLWAKNLNKEYIFANKAMCENLLCANDTDEPIGKTDMFFAERERNRYPEDKNWHTFGEICVQTDDNVLQEMRTMQYDEFGNIRGEFLFLDVHKAPFFDAQNNLIGIVGTARDETEKKKIEDKLHINSLNLEKALQATVEFIKPTGKIINYNSITKLLREITGSDCVIIDLFYPTYSQIVSFNGYEDEIANVEKVNNISLLDKKWIRNPELEKMLQNQNLTYLSDFTQIVSNEELEFVNLIQQEFKVGNVVIMPIEGNKKFLGVVMFVYTESATLNNVELIKMIGNQLGQFLERTNAEKALLIKMEEMERFHKLTVNREINMIELKKEVNMLLRALGREPKYKIVN